LIGSKGQARFAKISAREQFAPGALLVGSSAGVDASGAAAGGPPGYAGDADGGQRSSDARLRGRHELVDAGDRQFPADVKRA